MGKLPQMINAPRKLTQHKLTQKPLYTLAIKIQRKKLGNITIHSNFLKSQKN